MSCLMEFAGKTIDFARPKVMGVLNVTPDSFSDGGRFTRLDAALRQAERMVAEGAAFVDVGGESTRPGAQKVSVQEEMDRVLPIVEKIKASLDVVVSVDTSTPALMKDAAKYGAGLINDVRALQREGAIDVCRSLNLPVCIMHMQGQPDTMQETPHYECVEREVMEYLLGRCRQLEDRGIARERLLIDPGFGFGKTVQHNYQLLNTLDGLVNQHYPVLVGMSRKSMIGAVTGRDVDERLPGSLAAAVIAAMKGAAIIRVHDVKETVDAVRVVDALRENE